MNVYLTPALVVSAAILLAIINLMFPFAMSALMIVVSVVVAYSIIRLNSG
jgi:hypothetical protein